MFFKRFKIGESLALEAPGFKFYHSAKELLPSQAIFPSHRAPKNEKKLNFFLDKKDLFALFYTRSEFSLDLL